MPNTIIVTIHPGDDDYPLFDQEPSNLTVEKSDGGTFRFMEKSTLIGVAIVALAVVALILVASHQDRHAICKEQRITGCR